MTFGEKFRKVLTEKGVSQKKFAEDNSLNRGYVSRILNGENASSDFITKAIAYFPDVDPRYYFFDTEENFVQEGVTSYDSKGNAQLLITEIEEKLKELKGIMTQM